MAKRRCKYGRRKDGKCRKTRKKARRGRRKGCKFGRRKDGKCRKTPR